jgi:uncharacterized membrane protein (DUF2068 family)
VLLKERKFKDSTQTEKELVTSAGAKTEKELELVTSAAIAYGCLWGFLSSYSKSLDADFDF